MNQINDNMENIGFHIPIICLFFTLPDDGNCWSRQDSKPVRLGAIKKMSNTYTPSQQLRAILKKESTKISQYHKSCWEKGQRKDSCLLASHSKADVEPMPENSLGEPRTWLAASLLLNSPG